MYKGIEHTKIWELNERKNEFKCAWNRSLEPLLEHVPDFDRTYNEVNAILLNILKNGHGLIF